MPFGVLSGKSNPLLVLCLLEGFCQTQESCQRGCVLLLRGVPEGGVVSISCSSHWQYLNSQGETNINWEQYLQNAF